MANGPIRNRCERRLFCQNFPGPARVMEPSKAMKSRVVKRSVLIAGHQTSVSLEDAFWKELREIAGERNMTVADFIAAIDRERQHKNLSSAIRLFVLDFYRDQLSVERALINRPVELASGLPDHPQHEARLEQ